MGGQWTAPPGDGRRELERGNRYNNKGRRGRKDGAARQMGAGSKKDVGRGWSGRAQGVGYGLEVRRPIKKNKTDGVQYRARGARAEGAAAAAGRHQRTGCGGRVRVAGEGRGAAARAAARRRSTTIAHTGQRKATKRIKQWEVGGEKNEE